MQIKRMPYFEVIKLLEKALPSTVEFDYTKINGEQLWERVLIFLNEAQLELPNDFMKNIELEFKGLGDRLYGKKSHVLSDIRKKEDMGFDQNHYWIKDNVCHLKTMLMEKIYNKYYISERDGYERNNFGELEKVREHVSEEEIKKFVINHFVITKEKNASKIELIFPYLIAKQIFLYFGLEVDKQYDYDQDVSMVCEIITNVFEHSRVYHGERKREDGIERYESSSIDMDRFNLETQKAIEKIVKFISHKCNGMIQKGVERNQLLDQWERERQEKNNATGVEEELVVEKNKKSVEKQDESHPQYEEKDFDNLMSKYEMMQELIERNKQIAKQISELDRKRAELEQELAENNARLMEEFSRGAK